VSCPILTVLDDLLAEQAALDDIVAELSDDEWRLATPSPGWDVADQIGHLTYFDGAAVQAITDPTGFNESATALIGAWERVDEITLHRHLEPAALLDAWRHNRDRLAAAAGRLHDDARVVWYGPSMGAKSFLTARLMETWAHGQDVVDALGVEREATDRLRHVAQLGFITRKWTYANRQLDLPAGDVRVELVSPSGDIWLWGPGDAADVVGGPALDFCLVVTQRRHLDDTDLDVVGDVARDWLLKAQAFAGPATDGPAARGAR
jgi:uncharacterized protein (TIGR03084 family)